jgi:hypothetical protein
MDRGHRGIRDGHQYPGYYLRGPRRPAVRVDQFRLAIRAWRARGGDQPVDYCDPGRQYQCV